MGWEGLDTRCLPEASKPTGALPHLHLGEHVALHSCREVWCPDLLRRPRSSRSVADGGQPIPPPHSMMVAPCPCSCPWGRRSNFSQPPGSTLLRLLEIGWKSPRLGGGGILSRTKSVQQGLRPGAPPPGSDVVSDGQGPEDSKSGTGRVFHS